MRIPFFDATRAVASEEAELTAAFQRVLRSGRYILGPEVEAFEKRMAARLGVAHAIGVSSGTDALLVALMALGIGRGDEVIVPAYGFVATAEVVVRVGAVPVFADIERRSMLIDVGAARSCLTTRTKAIIAVHLFGAVADVEGLAALGPPVVEDAAQALGAACVGRVGALGCFSFFPTKNLGGFGDGGLVTTNSAALATRLTCIRSHGSGSGGYTDLGGNFRLDALHAALLSVRLGGLDAALARRRDLASTYRRVLDEYALSSVLEPPESGEGVAPNQFVVRVTGGWSRDGVQAELTKRGVETKIYYRAALPDEPCFHRLRTAEASEARRAARETLALPFYAQLTDDEVAIVAAAARQVVGLARSAVRD